MFTTSMLHKLDRKNKKGDFMKLKVKFNEDEKYIGILKDNTNENVSHNTVDTQESTALGTTFIAIYKTDNIQLEEPVKEDQLVGGLA